MTFLNSILTLERRPAFLFTDRIIPLTPELSEFRGVFSKRALEILKRVKELEPHFDLDQAIIAMGEVYLDKKDPVRKAKKKKIKLGVPRDISGAAPQEEKPCGSLRIGLLTYLRPVGERG